MWPLVSVQIVTYNRSAYLLQALQQIAAQDYPGALQVVVMDDSPRPQETTRFPKELDIRRSQSAPDRPCQVRSSPEK